MAKSKNKNMVVCAKCGESHYFTENVIGQGSDRSFVQDADGSVRMIREKFYDADEIDVVCGNCGESLDGMEVDDKNGDDTMRQRLYSRYGKTLADDRAAGEKKDKRVLEIIMSLMAHTIEVKEVLDELEPGCALESIKAIAKGLVELQENLGLIP